MNSEQQQQRIMGYFIEEAREHLQTIEQGVLNLQDVLGDPESVNELFRAAHSIKGGAAMLGVGSIQHVAHRLEDFFKILKENPKITVDERLKSLLLAGFDPLAELLDELQAGFRISDELTTETNNRVKPVFTELESYLNQLVSDADGEGATDTVNLEKENIINEPQKEITVSIQAVFHQEVTTKMRDMLQLFRGSDSAESRSQLQAICNYFQEIGNSFNLRNWTNLATQIKNAIAQPSNSYRTLAPILIRELKEAQDLVLSNREAEIVVSSPLQNLLPYWLSESEDDEISTLFITESEEKIEDELQIADSEVNEDKDIAITDRIDPDLDIDLFADQVNEEVFDLSEAREDRIDQMDWMDGEYEINEVQHIDGPKVGASELKSLAILFENDDIDFDSAWEDIESNETNISNQGSDIAIDSHDEFADLLNHDSDDAKSIAPNDLGIEESNIDQLFGNSSFDDLSSDESVIETNLNSQDSLFPEDLDTDLNSQDSLFPEDLDMEWNQDSEIDNLELQSSSEDLLASDLEIDESLDSNFNEFDELNLGIDIIDQITDSSDTKNVDDYDFSEIASSDIESFDRLLEDAFIDSQDSLDSLSSEEYFAEIERQEKAIAFSLPSDLGEEPQEPFALTFSEEGMTLLEDPFAINENLEGDLLEPSLISINGDTISSEKVDTHKASEIIEPDNLVSLSRDDEDTNSVDTSSLNIFDELGFDSDEPSKTQEISDYFEQPSTNALDIEDSGDILTFSDEPNENDTSISDSIAISNIELDNDFDSSEENIFDVGFDTPDDINALDLSSQEEASFGVDSDSSNEAVELNSVDSLDDFFTASEEVTNAFENVISDNDFADTTSSSDELDGFFESYEATQPVSTEELDFNSSNEDVDDDLGDFFADSEQVEIVNDIANNGVDNTEDLGDFFAGSEGSNVLPNSVENELDFFASEGTNVDDLGDFFTESEVAESLSEDIIDNVLIDLNINETNTDEVESEFAATKSSQFEDENFAEFTENGSSEKDLEEMYLDRINESQESNLADLFINAGEDDLTSIENVINDDFVFDEGLALTENENDHLTNTLEVDESPNLSTSLAVDDNLLSEQEDFNPSDLDDITSSTTIDNLVDFFQGDEDSEISSIHTSGELASDNLAEDIEIGFNEFKQFDDLNESRYPEISDRPITENLDTENQLIGEELNGIDDNFDFDDLEAMIGNSITSEISQSFENQVVDASIDGQPSVDSDDMNFDELEALLGDSSGFETVPATIQTNAAEVNNLFTAPVEKPADDFDELENMLQSAFAKEVGRLETKTPTRTPTTTRKPRLTDSTMRVDVKYLDSLNNLVGELVVNRNLLEQDQERLQQFITNLLHQVQLLSDVSQRMRDQYDRSLLEASLTAGRGRSYSNFDASYSSDGANSNSSASSDFEGIEFDRYNTFHVLSQEIIELIVRVRESASDIEFVVGETDQVTRQLGTITTQVQDDLKQSRMVPFAQIADRLPRGIRDRALKTGKQAELEIYGRETLIDKAILEQLTDPLTHLVNNAIDHGLEDPHTRQAAGKSTTGKLTVRAYHQGNQTVISISDDGAGISTDKVKKSAVSKGVRSQSEVDRLNDTEVYALLFEPGFSTAAQADEFKGRGVGLDVVKTCLDEIRGVIIVESVVGKGTTFTIRLPLTLSISKAMFCISDRARVAFPVDGFEDMVEVPQSQIVLNEKGQPCLPWRDTVLPFQHLSNLLSYSRHLSRSSIYGKQENDELCIIILRNDTSYLALQVDQFLGEYEIVIKQLEGPIPQPAGIAGATVLGDGRVMAIANVLELFDIASGRLRPSTTGITVQPPVEEDIAVDPTVLIVDDSITVRELLSLTFAKVGYRVEQAKDGQDAWEKLRAGLPCDMIFCDIEMPRMDGLDLLSRLQKDSRLKEIPVAMLTSRGADRHRQSAIQLGAKGYFTKPYLEEELLSASKRLLNGETLPI